MWKVGEVKSAARMRTIQELQQQRTSGTGSQMLMMFKRHYSQPGWVIMMAASHPRLSSISEEGLEMKANTPALHTCKPDEDFYMITA